MTTLEFVLILIIWVSYGVFNSWQHDYYKFSDSENFFISCNIIFAPIALLIRIFRGVFIWKGEYKS